MMALALPHFAAVLVCKVRGHKRGKRINADDGSFKLACPRCGAPKPPRQRKEKAA